ncbi:3-isopropylmalate dehydrogenase [Thecaphora frezii]
MASRTHNIVVLPGDHIGPEVIEQAVRVLELVSAKSPDFELKLQTQLFGGSAIDKHGKPFTEECLAACKAADAVLLGSIGGPEWGVGPVRPEQGLLALRKEFDLYANIRPALFPSESLVPYSPLKEEVVKGTEIIVVRENVGGIYFGKRQEANFDNADEDWQAWDTLAYGRSDVQRITRMAAHLAKLQNPPAKIHSIDKANVLATSRLWRKTVQQTIDEEFPELEVDHQFVDSASMVIVGNPKKLNGILLTENMFGDILSDETSIIPGSIGLLPSASLGGVPDGKSKCFGVYEPIHGSAPDISGRGIANPIGTILSAAMMLRYSLHEFKAAEAIELAVRKVLDAPEIGGVGLRTKDLGGEAGSKDVGDAVIAQLEKIL